MATQYLSTPRFFKGKLFSLLENLFDINNQTVSSEHSGYTFVRHTDAINFRPASSVGIYINSRGKKVFIKDYAYKLKNLDFEYLHNEINTLKLLNSKPLERSSVRVPRIINGEDKNRRITVVTEYVEGNTLDHSSRDVMQQVLINVITYLQSQSFKIPASLLKTIPKRLQLFTYITFPFYLVRALLKEPSKVTLFLKGCMVFLRYAPYCIFQQASYGLCHRDLSADNIIYDARKKQSIMLDTECMVQADILSDVALLPRLYVKYLNADQLLSIFHAFHLNRSDLRRLIVLMVTSCVSKISTEQKNARDYINAVSGLNLTVNKLIPAIEKEL